MTSWNKLCSFILNSSHQTPNARVIVDDILYGQITVRYSVLLKLLWNMDIVCLDMDNCLVKCLIGSSGENYSSTVQNVLLYSSTLCRRQRKLDCVSGNFKLLLTVKNALLHSLSLCPSPAAQLLCSWRPSSMWRKKHKMIPSCLPIRTVGKPARDKNASRHQAQSQVTGEGSSKTIKMSGEWKVYWCRQVILAYWLFIPTQGMLTCCHHECLLQPCSWWR